LQPATGLNGTGGFCDGEFIEFPDPSWYAGCTIAFAAISVMFALLGLIFLVRYWQRPIIRMSQREYLVVIMVALGFMNIGVLLLGGSMMQPSAGNCMASYSLLELAMACLLATLCVKEWRVWRVRAASLRGQSVQIGNPVMYSCIGAAVGILVAIIIPWFIVDPPTPDPCSDFSCSRSPLLFASWGWLMLLGLLTVSMAVLARDVPSVGSESASILYTSVLAAFVLIFLGMLVMTNAVTPRMQNFFISFGFMWISGCLVVLIVFRKYAWLSLGSTEIRAKFLQTNQSSSFQAGPGDYFSGETGRSQFSTPYSGTQTTSAAPRPSGTHNHSSSQRAEQVKNWNSYEPQQDHPIITTDDGDAAAVAPRDTTQTTPPRSPRAFLPQHLQQSHTYDEPSPSYYDASSSASSSFTSPSFTSPMSFSSSLPYSFTNSYGRSGPYSATAAAADGQNQNVDHTGSVENEDDEDGTYSAAEITLDVAPVSLPRSGHAEADAARETAFHVGETLGWEEYVDRLTGDSFWIRSETGEIARQMPAELVQLQHSVTHT